MTEPLKRLEARILLAIGLPAPLAILALAVWGGLIYAGVAEGPVWVVYPFMALATLVGFLLLMVLVLGTWTLLREGPGRVWQAAFPPKDKPPRKF